jgi:hypothetical protein
VNAVDGLFYRGKPVPRCLWQGWFAFGAAKPSRFNGFEFFIAYWTLKNLGKNIRTADMSSLNKEIHRIVQIVLDIEKLRKPSSWNIHRLWLDFEENEVPPWVLPLEECVNDPIPVLDT